MASGNEGCVKPTLPTRLGMGDVGDILTFEALRSLRVVSRGESLFECRARSHDDVFVIPNILDDKVSVNSSDNDMMESAGGINACITGHGKIWHENKEMSICHQCPPMFSIFSVNQCAVKVKGYYLLHGRSIA